MDTEYNILPPKYPNIYSSTLNRWVDEDYYTIYHEEAEKNEKKVDKHHKRQYDDDALLVIITKFFTTGEDYTIIGIEFGNIGKDVFIYNIEIMGYLNGLPDFDRNDKRARAITDNEITYLYQDYERFFGGYQDKMTSIKDMVMDISTTQWYENPDLEWF